MHKFIVAAGLMISSAAYAADKPWTSLIVRGNGQFDMHEGIKSETSCREALCYVQWNISCDAHAKQLIEDKRKADMADIEQKKRELIYMADHPCTVNKDGSKDCPTDFCSTTHYDKDGKSSGISSCMTVGTSSFYNGVNNSITVAACFQP